MNLMNQLTSRSGNFVQIEQGIEFEMVDGMASIDDEAIHRLIKALAELAIKNLNSSTDQREGGLSA